ncbi:OmpA family protein [Chryseobacterium chendengshani]|uniref:OmpA family protein n=1 Tax=unclassified Chryseobacterium TaxID=2593645 RepID=UPI001C642BE3|nr:MULTISPECIES: OmpA family protein [unclassified Chryseobacterium]MBW7676770.1 OmpA family protein [Chryseobacterium sp. LJ756]MBW8523313.1 OmpA family protein [Chryseobacterium sp. LJ668]QYK15605.1 OmpA family protein [Chryseobacterium sp. LJ668]
MKLSLAIFSLALAMPASIMAQDSLQVSSTGEYPNTFSSGSANVSPFTQQSKRFNDWSVSFGAGVPLVQSADLTSIKNGNGKNLIGYSAYVSIDKAITHAFGINLQYDRGETRQGWFNTKDAAPANASINRQEGARTQYDAISILGDINFSNLMRRVDNKSPYRWALHGYAGIGAMAYKAYLKDEFGQRLMTEIKPFKTQSFFGQAGAGLKYKINNRLDLEGRVMYVVTTDDHFDGGGQQYSDINRREDQVSDNFFNATLGLSVKLGKHESHLMWHDPLQEIYYKLDVLAEKNQDIDVCKAGDADNDGVCDDWDRQLDTPAGARVDGAGVALDVDLDGVIDLYDKCVTVPGPVENNGCPTTTTSSNSGTVTEAETKLDGIEFDLNSDRILPSNTPILNNAVNYINTSNGAFTVIGTTDTRGSEAYNQNLSEKRANSVKDYLVKNGVESTKLDALGRGKKDLKYPECDPATKCPEWKNRANRRVYFEAK